jgi:hypothetical protein
MIVLQTLLTNRTCSPFDNNDGATRQTVYFTPVGVYRVRRDVTLEGLAEETRGCLFSVAKNRRIDRRWVDLGKTCN